MTVDGERWARPTIYGDYVALAVATPNSQWHIQGRQADLALCGKRLTGDRRRMELHVSLLECPKCMDLGGKTEDDDRRSSTKKGTW